MFMLAARAERRTVRVYTCTHMYTRTYVRTHAARILKTPAALVAYEDWLVVGDDEHVKTQFTFTPRAGQQLWQASVSYSFQTLPEAPRASHTTKITFRP